MKNWISRTLIALVLVIAAPLAASADTWQIDPAHTTVGFTVRHMTISSVRGQFDKVAGTITANGNDPASAVIEATIDTASIDTRSADRDADLKSANFLDVAKYPTMTFKSKKIEAAGTGQVERRRRPHAARRHQGGHARGRGDGRSDQGSVGQHARRRIRDHHDQPQGLRAYVE